MSRYLRFTRSAYYGAACALPLLLLYELLLAWNGIQPGGQIRNAGDVWLRMLLASLELRPTHATLVMILAVVLAIPVLRRGEARLEGRYLLGLGLEALAYSLVLDLAINIVLGFIFSALPSSLAGLGLVGFWPVEPWLLEPPALAIPAGVGQGLALSLGAGLFEELIFRVILLWGLLALTRLVLPVRLAGFVAIVAAALLFSAAHYVGPFGDPYTFASFLFRFIAGLLFTMLYHARGFAVAAYSHALYDIRVILF